jgi:hypothetical protein
MVHFEVRKFKIRIEKFRCDKVVSMCQYDYSVRRLKGSLWADTKAITTTEWFNLLMCFVHCVYITGEAIFDYNKWLIQITVILLSGGHCNTLWQSLTLFLKTDSDKIEGKTCAAGYWGIMSKQFFFSWITCKKTTPLIIMNTCYHHNVSLLLLVLSEKKEFFLLFFLQ